MTREDLNNLIAFEGFTTEFKRSGTSNLGRELCAFANASGGVVLIGVADAGTVCGVSDHNALKSAVQNVARCMEPAVVVDLESVDDVLVISVPPQNGKPYSSAGKFYLRDGATSQQMSRDEIRAFFFEEGVIHFDETPCDRFDLEVDLTDDVWQGFCKRAKIPEGMEPISTLQNLGLLKGDKMTHAGAWVLAKDIQKFSLRAHVSCALFQGTSKTYILDRKDFTADLYTTCQDVAVYVRSKLNTEFIINKQVRCEERLELPEDALREAIVNVVMHRDYRSTANVQVYIFRDRVEVVNPGGLPAGMKVEELGSRSVPRNPLLFGVCYRMDMVEQVGSGIRRIRELCQDYGVPDPQIIPQDDWMTVVFPRDPVKAGFDEKEGERPESTDPVTDPVTQEIRILLSLLQTNTLSTHEIMNSLNLSHRSSFRKNYTHPVLELGLIERTIPDKPNSRLQKYRLTEKGRRVLASLEQKSEN